MLRSRLHRRVRSFRRTKLYEEYEWNMRPFKRRENVCFSHTHLEGTHLEGTHLEDTCQGKKIPLSKFFDFFIFMSCRQSLPVPFFLLNWLQSSLCHTPIRIEATPRDHSQKRALPLYSGPENLRFRAGSNSFLTIPMVLTPVLLWLPARAVKIPVTLMLLGEAVFQSK